MSPHPLRFRTLRRALLGLLLAICVAYIALLSWFRLNEDALLFRPTTGNLEAPPAHLDLQSTDVALTAADSTPLVARLIPPPPRVDGRTAPWILYFHGASGNVATRGYNEAWARFRRLGLGVLAVDYRGYGQSGGTPNEAGLYLDADAAYRYLTDRLQVAPTRLIIYGYSLGSAVAIDLAARREAAGLIVEGAFTSIPDRGAELYPYVPVRLLARNRFASVEKISRVVAPKLFIHARQDSYVPFAHGQTLFERARPPKFFQAVAGGHIDAYKVDPSFFSAVARFVSGLGLAVDDHAPP